MGDISCCFVTLGCAKNEVDTNRMQALLEENGIDICDTANESDVVIVNTCAFLTYATQESIETTLELASAMDDGVRRTPIIMCGCLPSRYGVDLADELPEVAAFVPVDEEDQIADVVREVVGAPQGCPVASDVILRRVDGASSFVKISDGCDRFCTFCAIPYIRGRYASRESDAILSEVHKLVEGGVREVVLIGQDTGIWGQDLPGERDLAWLLEQVALEVRPYGAWVRVLYLQPEGMTDRLIGVLRDVPEVLPYIDIPIQHCDEDVLRRMGRSGSRRELAALFERLRREIPGMVLRSTGMVGFPGETEEQFDELLQFMEETAFDYTSVFSFSPEEGTVAADLDGQVDDETKLERTQRLVDLTEAIGFAATAAHVGETVDVIIDGVEEADDGAELIGHAWFQAPDCDGAVHIPEGEATVGEMVRCRLTDSFCYELLGEVITNETR